MIIMNTRSGSNGTALNARQSELLSGSAHATSGTVVVTKPIQALKMNVLARPVCRLSLTASIL